MWAPQLSGAEALGVELRHFIDCIGSGATPLTGGTMGLGVVRILEAAQTSMKRRGQPVELA